MIEEDFAKLKADMQTELDSSENRPMYTNERLEDRFKGCTPEQATELLCMKSSNGTEDYVVSDLDLNLPALMDHFHLNTEQKLAAISVREVTLGDCDQLKTQLEHQKMQDLVRETTIRGASLTSNEVRAPLPNNSKTEERGGR